MNKLFLICTLLLSVLLSGCWDQRELSDVSVAIGMAVDKGEKEKYRLSVEGINATELNSKTAGGFTPSVVFTIEGDTIAELAQKMNVGASKHVIYSHMRTFVMSEEIAREGLISFLDYLERNREIRDDFNILISRGVSPDDILKVTYPLQKSSSLKLHTQLQSMVDVWGGDPNVRLNDVIQALTSPGKQPVMAAVSVRGNPKKGGSLDNLKMVTPNAMVVLDSLAIFKNYKLIGYVSLDDTRNYLWAEDKLSRTALSVPCGKDKFLAAQIYNSKTRKKAKMVRGIPVINISINSEAYIDAVQCSDDLTQVKTYEKYQKLAEEEIKRKVSATIKKVQQKYGSDIFGFGEDVYHQDYRNFKKVQNNWDKSFKEAIVHVYVKVQLRRSGIRTKSMLSNKK
ncbi:Ger(x)C family spore germination protein [Bacillus sp. BRMEA1]|uniref:Ger(x)C family spore germination protein n=1 Tax=Neobacillus endophyticus TaxID=2738405 RepID=UPI0015646EFA|nr:Ger(x)C family spore germination protein [Neobacillus endophyticus]NRD78649.1 Ger(x)C family spore germination protein [Neobacillus endophyticus]